MVLSRNEDENADGETHYSRVTELFVRHTDLLYHLTFADGTRLETTWNHPFWVEGSGWVETKDLKAGDLTVLSSGSRLEIQSVRETPQDHEVTVYNFEVENDHTYFVADSDTASDAGSFVWVHNNDATYLAPLVPLITEAAAVCTASGPAIAGCAVGAAVAVGTACALNDTCSQGAGSYIAGGINWLEDQASDAWDYVFGAEKKGTPEQEEQREKTREIQERLKNGEISEKEADELQKQVNEDFWNKTKNQGGSWQDKLYEWKLRQKAIEDAKKNAGGNGGVQ